MMASTRGPLAAGARAVAFASAMALVVGGALAVAAQAPADTASAPGKAAMLTAARTVIGAARYATFVTVGDDGQPRARIVDPFAPEVDFTVWVGTNALTRKVGEIARNPRVTLLYFDPRAQHYVTLIGLAAVERNPALKARWWKPEWAAFYPNGAASDDYVLIRVQPQQLEIVAPSLKMNTDPKTWRPLSVALP